MIIILPEAHVDIPNDVMNNVDSCSD